MQAFTIDTVRAENIDFIRAQYADNILAKLRGVDNDTDSYAIVVYGSWGTGKTTFLNYIKARLDERNENVFEFNPWNCSTPQQIVSDFFYLLADVLKQYDSSLSKPIVRYSELLDAVDAPKPLEYIGNLLSHQDDGITEMKEHIVNSLKKIRVPIYVLIDDLDRMNKEEVLAVIRLIRNTANFPYLKFVVACDYNYIKKLLNDQINILYLEKIFMAEFHLPTIYAEYPCVDCCCKDIRKMISDELVNDFFKKLSDGDFKIIEQSLGNLRQSKRFARELVADWDFAKNNRVRQQVEISFNDYFWIELLKYTHFLFYKKLERDPLAFFEVKTNFRYNVSMYVLKKDYNSEENLAKLEVQILQKVFSFDEFSSVYYRSVSLVENYDKYFSFGKAAGHLSQSDYVNLLYHGGGKEVRSIKVAEMTGRQVISLLHLVMMTTPSKLKSDIKKAYIDIIFTLGYRLSLANIKEIVEQKFPDLLKSEDAEDIKSYLLKKMTDDKNTYQDILVSNVISRNMILHLLDESQPIIEKETLETIIKDNFKKYVADNPCDASDIVRKYTRLNRIVSSSVLINAPTDDNPYVGYDCLVFDELTEWFKCHKSHNLQVVKDFEKLNVPDDASESELYDASESKEEEINCLFGNFKNFEKFKEECFE